MPFQWQVKSHQALDTRIDVPRVLISSHSITTRTIEIQSLSAWLFLSFTTSAPHAQTEISISSATSGSGISLLSCCQWHSLTLSAIVCNIMIYPSFPQSAKLLNVDYGVSRIHILIKQDGWTCSASIWGLLWRNPKRFLIWISFRGCTSFDIFYGVCRFPLSPHFVGQRPGKWWLSENL